METISEVLGKSVRAARVNAGHTTTSLAAELARRTGDNWHREKVSRIENGRRQLTASELILVAWILRVSVDSMFYPAANTKHMVSVEGVPIHLAQVMKKVLPDSGPIVKKAVDDIETLRLEQVKAWGEIRNNLKAALP